MITEQQLAAIETALTGLGFRVVSHHRDGYVLCQDNRWIEADISGIEIYSLTSGRGDVVEITDPIWRTALRAIDAVLEGE